MPTIIYKSSPVMEICRMQQRGVNGVEWLYIDGRVTPPERHNTLKFLHWASGMIGSLQIVLATSCPRADDPREAAIIDASADMPRKSS